MKTEQTMQTIHELAHSYSIDNMLKEFNVSPDAGLSSKEVLKRQKKYGFNILESQKRKSLLLRFLSQFADFMIVVLIFAAIISFVVSVIEGHADYVDPIIIFSIIILNAILGVVQEAKAEKSLLALKKLSAPSALVLRDQKKETIPSKELVPGDIIFLETGHYVPADARLLTSINLKVDESSLTGESHPIEKNAMITLPDNTLLADRINCVPATGIVTYGRGTAIVTATGMNTQVGAIAKMIMEDDTPQTPLQKRLAKTGKGLGIAALFICIVIFVVGTMRGNPIFDMFMTSVSLAVAAIPEGLPSIITIMLSLGVQRMAKKNAVIRKLPAVETLGSATIICSDKTGTLTQNKMTVTKIASSSGFEKLNSTFASLLFTFAALCNDAMGEATEEALIQAAKENGISKSKLDLTKKRISEIPFDSTRKQMTTVHKLEYGYQSITKGAPDILIKESSYLYENGKVIPFSQSKKNIVLEYNTKMAKEALRVIAISYREFSNLNDIPKSPKLLESGLIFVGLIGMIDPPRPEVRQAVMTCKLAGIQPIMITGDQLPTACAIARELGILSEEKQAITGAALNEMTPKQLREQIYQYHVFARVTPEHKVRIVKAFQANDEVVAMTGDGVNDAPALKCADIGCAMGIGGTDVAKNAADMILTDDNFATIVSAIKEGRGIYDNIIKSIHFLLSSNIGEIITIFVAILFGLPTPLLAVQLLWVNLVTDSLPAISLGVEPPAKNIMKKQPISPKKGMFADGLIFKIIFEGAMIGFLALFAFMIGSHTYQDLELGRTMSFSVLSISQLFHAFNMRSDQSLLKIGLFSNWKLLVSFVICIFLQITVITIQPLATIFSVVSLNITQWIIVFLLSFVPIIIVELQKRT